MSETDLPPASILQFPGNKNIKKTRVPASISDGEKIIPLFSARRIIPSGITRDTSIPALKLVSGDTILSAPETKAVEANKLPDSQKPAKKTEPKNAVNMEDAELSHKLLGNLTTDLIIGLHEKYPLYDVDERTKNLLRFPLTFTIEPKFKEICSELPNKRVHIKYDEGNIAIEYNTLTGEEQGSKIRRRRLYFAVVNPALVYFEDLELDEKGKPISGSIFHNSLGAVNAGLDMITELPGKIEKVESESPIQVLIDRSD